MKLMRPTFELHSCGVYGEDFRNAHETFVFLCVVFGVRGVYRVCGVGGADTPYTETHTTHKV